MRRHAGGGLLLEGSGLCGHGRLKLREALEDARAAVELSVFPTLLLFAFGGLMACLAAGYGVLFTIVDDYRDEYGISETAIGVVIGIGFTAAFLSQLVIAPLADRGHARAMVLFGKRL